MGSDESKAQVIDENDEYRYGVTTGFDQNFSSPSPSATRGKRSLVSESGVEELVDVPKKVENALSLAANVLETYGEKTNENVMMYFKIIEGMKFFSAVAGVVLNSVVDDAVSAQLNKIHKEIREVRNDIKELERTMKWETTRIQYADICTMIVTGMEFCKQIQSNAGNESLKHDYEERLKELCSNQGLTLAMNTLLDGITGKGDFRTDILRLIYDQTSGSRPDVMRMAGRLLQLLTGGLTTLVTFETLKRGRQSAAQMVQAMYADRVKEAEQCYMNVVQRCVHESKENMAKDVDRICDGKMEFIHPCEEICNELARKYDWLRFQCMAYSYGLGDVYCHGSRIEKLITRHPGFLKCALLAHYEYITCFYTSKHAPLRTFSSCEKKQIDEIFSNWYKKFSFPLRGTLLPFVLKPDKRIDQYMDEISDKRQCWAVRPITPQQLFLPIKCAPGWKCNSIFSEVNYAKSEGSYQHLQKVFDGDFCFVSLFFQD